MEPEYNYHEKQLQSIYGECEQRRIREGAQLGKLNIALIWNDISDLDLHVKCPCSNNICHLTKTCYQCQGTLDVDMNCRFDIASATPIENIFWHNPLTGKYHIRVKNFSNRSIGQIPVQFQCVVTYNQRKHLFEGEVPSNQEMTIFHDHLSRLFPLETEDIHFDQLMVEQYENSLTEQPFMEIDD